MNVTIVIGSITEQEVDVIVNSANTELVMGGGVAAAILAEAGPEVEEEAIAQAPIAVGEVIVTHAGELPAKWIVHVAVVGLAPPDIYECTANALHAAADLEAGSIAFPALGTGSAGISTRESAQGMCEAIMGFAGQPSCLSEVRIVLWDDRQFNVFSKALRLARRKVLERDN